MIKGTVRNSLKQESNESENIDKTVIITDDNISGRIDMMLNTMIIKMLNKNKGEI